MTHHSVDLEISVFPVFSVCLIVAEFWRVEAGCSSGETDRAATPEGDSDAVTRELDNRSASKMLLP
jgi:hypothetical protein